MEGKRVTEWLAEAADGQFYRPFWYADLEPGTKVLRLELPRLQTTSGAVYALREHLELLEIDRNECTVRAKKAQTEVTLTWAELWNPRLAAIREREHEGRPWREYDLVYLIERPRKE